MGLDFSLVIPLYNEEEGARGVVDNLISALDEALLDYELVLVDNGSRDMTPQILESLAREKGDKIKIVHVPVNQGYGWGIINGLNAATGTFVGYMCGDGQIQPKDVIKVFDRIRAGNCDLAKVKRVARHDGLLRKILSRGYNSLFLLWFNVKSLDVNGTPKILKRDLLERFNPVSKDWFIDAEMMIKAKHLNLNVEEVPAQFVRREAGRSNVRFGTIWEFWKNMVGYRFGRRMQEWQKKISKS